MESKNALGSLPSRWLVVGLCMLSPLTRLKVGDIQSAEVLGAAFLLLASASFWTAGLVARDHQALISLVRAYIFFIVAIILVSLLALRLPTFPPPDAGVLKTAPFLSIARAIQLVVASASMLLLASAFLKRPTLMALAAQCYVYGGIITAIYAVTSWLLLHVGVDLQGAYGEEYIRARGFFVEGGPLGVYLVSVVVVAVFRRYALGRGHKLTFMCQLLLLGGAFYCSYSKAGLLLALLLGVSYVLFGGKFRYLFWLAILALPLFLFTSAIDGIIDYGTSSANFDRVARSDDPSLITGRVMGAILVPIMTAHEPWLGIGFGSYPLQRNNPTYLGPLPRVDEWDLPGLGLLGYLPEIGIPLFLFLCWLLWKPVSMSKRVRAPVSVVLLAASQFYVHLLGAQLTFIYPWILSSMAIGYVLLNMRCDGISEVS